MRVDYLVPRPMCGVAGAGRREDWRPWRADIQGREKHRRRCNAPSLGRVRLVRGAETRLCESSGSGLARERLQALFAIVVVAGVVLTMCVRWLLCRRPLAKAWVSQSEQQVAALSLFLGLRGHLLTSN